jgi:hypothetical protein
MTPIRASGRRRRTPPTDAARDRDRPRSSRCGSPRRRRGAETDDERADATWLDPSGSPATPRTGAGCAGQTAG